VANNDTEEAKKEIERLAKEQANKEAKEAKQSKKEAERLAKEEAKKKAEDEKRFKEAEARAKKDAEKLAKEQTKKEAKQAKQAKEEPAPDVSSATYEGNFQLVLPSAVGFKQVKQFTQHLAGIEGVEVVWTGGSLDEGTLITVSVAQATPLARILSEMPMVGGVEVNGKNITVTFEASV